MAVPGIIFAGSTSHRSVHGVCSLSLASRKFGAIAFLSCAGLPIAWHFKHGAALLVKRFRAMAFSASVISGALGGIYGSGCDEIASKKSTSLRISSSDSENV